MSEPALVIPGSAETPSLHINANPVYALYHYLVSEGTQPSDTRHASLSDAARRVADARHLRGVHGIWDVWEQPLAAAESASDGFEALRASMTETVEQLGAAMQGAEPIYRREIWPKRYSLVAAALDTMYERFVPVARDLMLDTARRLDLLWPDLIDVYLVPDCYAWQGGYSHPVTIDVSSNTGTVLCETLLHEITHVADVHTSDARESDLGRRLTARLRDDGVGVGDAWQAWHGVIFTSSAYEVRAHIDPGHKDFAASYDLYSRCKVPTLAEIWAAHARGEIDEQGLFDRISAQVRATI
jgi:hypothetical protein